MTLHENDRHRADEERIIKAVAERFECEYEICSHGAYPVDGLLKRNKKCIAFVEARKVGYSRSEYPWFIWSVQKYVTVLRFAEVLRVLLAVEYPEGIYYHQIRHGRRFEVVYVDRGKTTGRTSADNEPCVRILNETFLELGADNEEDNHPKEP